MTLLSTRTVLRAIILTGAGQGLTRRIETSPRPVIAAVNGLAFGTGWFAFAASTGDVTAGLHRFFTRKQREV
jgi:enoyl-CoA hydratase/carnithine racemase